MKKKRNLIVVCCVAVVIFVATTIAYFSNGFDFLTGFGAEPFNTSVTEQFVSPQNWKPGDVTDKQVIATNNSDIDVAVRLSYTEKWVTANGDTISNKNNGEKMAIINLDNRTDWVKFGGYYYYNDVLSKNESTSSFLSSVAFNPSAVIGEQDCTTSNDETEITCISGGDGYDNATYSLTFNIEFVQADQYKKVWNTDFIVGNYYPFAFADYLTEDVNDVDISYNGSNKKNQPFTYDQPATDQTPALTEYRYIGDSPDNYVYFNCTDESDTSTCEVWRIVGVFNVENQNGVYKKRVKIIQTPPKEKTTVTSIWNGSYYEKLNSGEYWNSLSDVAKNMIGISKYYISTPSTYSSCSLTGELAYVGERSKNANKYNMTSKIALMYMSDYFYSAGTGNVTNGWIYQTNLYSGSYYNFFVNNLNTYDLSYSSGSCVYSISSGSYVVRPVLYLNENVEYVAGDGKVDNPYQIKVKSFNINIPESELYSAPESAAVGSAISINVLNDSYEILSFKLNGNLITGNSFIMPKKDVNITDVQCKRIVYNIINDNTDIVVQGSAHIGDTVYLNSDNFIIDSFKVNGVLVNGNSFVMPEEDVIISDVQFKSTVYNIINNDSDVIVQDSANIGDTVYLGSNSSIINSFKLNGVLVNGNSFVMPEEDVVISDVEKVSYHLVESEHYPYQSGQNYTKIYENTFIGASSITLEISYQLYLSGSSLYIYDSSTADNSAFVTRFNGTQSSLTDTTYTINGNYVKISFSSASSSYIASRYTNYYGYSIKIIPNF